MFRTPVLVVIAQILLLLSNNSLAANEPVCPASFPTWWVGSGFNFFAPDPRGPFSSSQAVLDTVIKTSEETWPGYVYTPMASAPEGSGYYDLTINGVPYYAPDLGGNIGAQILVNKYPTCPSGFNFNNRGVCTNDLTHSCDCPVGEKFKHSANRCIGILRIATQEDPDKDNGPSCAKGSGEPDQPRCGNPINPGSGNKLQIEEDFKDSNIAEGLGILRIYNASPSKNEKNSGYFGTGWSFSYDRRISAVPGRPILQCFKWIDDGSGFCEQSFSESGTGSNTIAIYRSDGKKLYFSRILGGSTIFKSEGVSDTINYNAWLNNDIGPAYIYSRDNFTTEVYSANGDLNSIEELNGSTWKVTNFSSGNDSRTGRWPSDSPICNHVQAGPIIYGSRPLCVTDNWGRQLNFEYERVSDTQVRIIKIFDPANHQYTYAYDGPSGGCLNRGEATPACSANNLTSVTYPNSRSRTYHYNEASQINGGTECSQYTSLGHGFGGLLNSLTGITDENGVRFASWTYDCNGRATSSQHAGGAEKVEIGYSGISSDGTGTSTVTHFTGDPASPTATTRIYTYQLVNGTPLLTATDKPCIDCGNVASRTYDVNGNTSAYTDWNGNRTTFVFDLTRNLETSRTEAVGTSHARTISTAWHATLRLPLQLAEPKRLTTFTYDSNGNLLTRTVQATTDPSGAAAFNAGTTGIARSWIYTYNNVGQVLSIRGPRTDVADLTQFTYDDGGNLATITNSLNQVTLLSNYDANRNVGQIIEPNGVTTTISYTPRGWMSSRSVSAGGMNQTTTYAYDGVGQVTNVVQPDNTVITYSYDDAHRLSAIADGKGNRITYGYDVMSNRVMESVIDPENVLRRQVVRSYNVLNKLHQITGAKQ